MKQELTIKGYNEGEGHEETNLPGYFVVFEESTRVL